MLKFLPKVLCFTTDCQQCNLRTSRYFSLCGSKLCLMLHFHHLGPFFLSSVTPPGVCSGRPAPQEKWHDSSSPRAHKALRSFWSPIAHTKPWSSDSQLGADSRMPCGVAALVRTPVPRPRLWRRNSAPRAVC